MRIITFGTFDLFHIGHLNILNRAKSYGDSLVVGVSSDELNFKKKLFYPLFPYQDRANIIKALSCVDEVFQEDSLEKKKEYIIQYQADILVMGDDWYGKFDELNSICKVIYLTRTADISSTALKERIRFTI